MSSINIIKWDPEQKQHHYDVKYTYCQMKTEISKHFFSGYTIEPQPSELVYMRH